MNIPSSVEKPHIIKDEIHTKNPRWNRLMKWWLHSLLSFRRRWLPMMRSRSSILIICVTFNSFKSCKTIYSFFFYQKLYFNVVSLFDEKWQETTIPKNEYWRTRWISEIYNISLCICMISMKTTSACHIYEFGRYVVLSTTWWCRWLSLYSV